MIEGFPTTQDTGPLLGGATRMEDSTDLETIISRAADKISSHDHLSSLTSSANSLLPLTTGKGYHHTSGGPDVLRSTKSVERCLDCQGIANSRISETYCTPF
ncbi:hypothetical protein RUM44_010157 [Polyplax serrata]|uniref:Uncharacterized protein n=1 Tax=Polyplax serrata TaxID=468196 RepID=A0ABR1AV08_POLSC